ncbi:MAG: S-layer homology domain-containing protein [Acutalibacteraceae bacterium]
MKKNLKRTLSVMLVLVMMIPIFAMPADAAVVGVYVKPANYIDVPKDRWSHPYISYVTSFNLMNGTGNNCFSPYGTLTKGEVDIVLKRVKGLNPTWQANPKIYTRNDTVYAIWQNAGYPYASKSVVNKYSDSWKIPENYKQAWAWCINNKILGGTSNTTLSPLNNLTREQFAKLITNYHMICTFGVVLELQ